MGPIQKYVVIVRSEKMPSKCWGKYGHVAVIETDGIHMPSRIAPRDKSVVSIKYHRRRLFWGKTDKCALRCAINEAKNLASQLNH